ncbi:MAG TPA: cytochrome b [Thiobacillaceae bacterium]|nr:cytochrome b [Thiobacillaceae bacterium]
MTSTLPSIPHRSGMENTRERYGSIARILHWSIAWLFLASYAAVYTRHWFTLPKTPENWIALQTHLVVGVLIAILVVARVIWRVRSPQPDDVPGTRLEHLASHAMHIALYFVMIIMPISGYLGTGVAIEVPLLGDIPSFKDTALFQSLGVDWETFEKPVDFVHKNGGAYVVWVLVVLHAAAAFYHHFVRRDDVMRRMLSPSRQR